MGKVSLKKFNNSWYNPGASLIKRTSWYFTNVLFFLNPWNPSSYLKVALLRLFGAKIGSGVIIKPAINIKYPWLLEVGNDVWIGENVWIDNLAKVTVGNDVCLSQGAMLLTGNHNYKEESFDLILGEIKLGDGCWVGAKAVVCPGVSCASHSILAVGSVANKDLQEFGIYQGNPAVLIRKREIE